MTRFRGVTLALGTAVLMWGALWTYERDWSGLWFVCVGCWLLYVAVVEGK